MDRVVANEKEDEARCEEAVEWDLEETYEEIWGQEIKHG